MRQPPPVLHVAAPYSRRCGSPGRRNPARCRHSRIGMRARRRRRPSRRIGQRIIRPDWGRIGGRHFPRAAATAGRGDSPGGDARAAARRVAPPPCGPGRRFSAAALSSNRGPSRAQWRLTASTAGHRDVEFRRSRRRRDAIAAATHVAQHTSGHPGDRRQHAAAGDRPLPEIPRRESYGAAAAGSNGAVAFTDDAAISTTVPHHLP